MSVWKACKARQVLAALIRIGWVQFKQVGSHRRLRKPGWKNYTFSFHDGDEIGPAALSRISKDTGLRPEDL
jgi:predicted RNA binding protein YcfA (HicA-like mRNA interferase family)